MCSRSRVFNAYKPLLEPLRNGPYSYLCTSSTLPELASVTEPLPFLYTSEIICLILPARAPPLIQQKVWALTSP